jgi:hypothetical protein
MLLYILNVITILNVSEPTVLLLLLADTTADASKPTVKSNTGQTLHVNGTDSAVTIWCRVEEGDCVRRAGTHRGENQGNSQIFHTNSDMSHIRPRPLLFTSFPVHFSLITVLFNACVVGATDSVTESTRSERRGKNK